MRTLRFRKVNYLAQSQNHPSSVCWKWMWTQLSDSKAKGLHQHAVLGGWGWGEEGKIGKLVTIEEEIPAHKQWYEQWPGGSKAGAELDLGVEVISEEDSMGTQREAVKILQVEEARVCAKDEKVACLGTAKSSTWLEEVRWEKGGTESGKTHSNKMVKYFKCYPRESGFHSIDGWSQLYHTRWPFKLWFIIKYNSFPVLKWNNRTYLHIPFSSKKINITF